MSGEHHVHTSTAWNKISPWKKPHNMTSSSIEPSAEHARVDTLEWHSNAGSCGLRAAARGSCQHVVPVRPSRHVPGWRGLTAAVIWQKVQGKNFLARMGRLCLACSNEHGSWLVGKSEQRLETERPRGLISAAASYPNSALKYKGKIKGMPKIRQTVRKNSPKKYRGRRYS